SKNHTTTSYTTSLDLTFWQPSCSGANSYYFDKHGDVPLRPSTTFETYWRSRTFRLSDYQFENRAEVVGAR
ncbi:hypothetical protein PP619_17095, partial [Mycobacteroides abscessus]|nr:hypothetical protein [Mycobacteroides abscessus]